MVNGNGSDAVEESEEPFPERLWIWMDIEERVKSTRDAVAALEGGSELTVGFLSEVLRAVRFWAGWELWWFLQGERYTPDGLLRAIAERDSLPTIKFVPWYRSDQESH